MTNQKEVWRDVEGFEGVYVVSNLGNVARIYGDQLRYLKACNAGGRTGREYLYVNFSHNGVHKTSSVHRLVATAFCERGPRQNEVDHIDGNKLNNNASNLRWMTHLGNVRAYLNSSKKEKKLEAILTSGNTAGEMLAELRKLMPKFDFEEVK